MSVVNTTPLSGTYLSLWSRKSRSTFETCGYYPCCQDKIIFLNRQEKLFEIVDIFLRETLGCSTFFISINVLFDSDYVRQ